MESKRKHKLSNYRKQQLLYIAVDILSAIVVWLLFLSFRWMVYEGKLFGVDTVLIPAFNFYRPLIYYPIVCVAVYYLSGYYLRPFGKKLSLELKKTFLSAVVIALLAFFVIIIDDVVESYVQYYISFFVLLALQFVCSYFPRLLITLFTRCRERKGQIERNTAIVGDKAAADKLQQELVDTKIVCVVTPQELADFAIVKQQHHIEHVIIALDDANNERELYEIIGKLYPHHVNISFVSRVYDMLTGTARIRTLSDVPLVTITDLPMGDVQLCTKRAFDICVSAVCLVLLSPLFLIVGILVRRSSKGGAFYRQERIGLYGQPFNILKFRTMYADSEGGTPQLASADDPRITPIGHILRKYRIDELPQFWNVLVGDMSIVGPRPERAFYIKQIVEQAPYYCLLYKIRPGLTSWGPIKVGYTDTIEKMVKRLNYDIVYIENMSLGLDIKIMFYTIKVILDGKGQ